MGKYLRSAGQGLRAWRWVVMVCCGWFGESTSMEGSGKRVVKAHVLVRRGSAGKENSMWSTRAISVLIVS